MMLIMHEIARIKNQIDMLPEEYEKHVKDIQAIHTEFNRGLPSKNLIDDLIKYASKSYMQYLTNSKDVKPIKQVNLY